MEFSYRGYHSIYLYRSYCFHSFATAIKNDLDSIDFGATTNEEANSLNATVKMNVSYKNNSNDESNDQPSRDNKTEALEVASIQEMNNDNGNGNGNVLNMRIDHSFCLEEVNGVEMQIKEELKVKLKDVPIEVEMPMRRFMACEVDSSEHRSNTNEVDANLDDV